MTAIFKYPGAKWRIAQWIVNYFPPHKSYLEPYGGSLAVLYNKPRSPIETVNDLDGEIVNLYRWIRDDPDRLARELYDIPYARQIYEDAYTDRTQDSLRQAVNTLVRLEMGHGFRTTGEKSGWKSDIHGREKAYAAANWMTIGERIKAATDRLRGVQIEHRPALDLMDRFNYSDVLVYLDPPYVMSARCRKIYKHEMTDRDHVDLLDAAKGHKGPVLISGYSTRLYEDALQGWHREEIDSRTQDNIKIGREILWMNYDPPARQYDITDYLEG